MIEAGIHQWIGQIRRQRENTDLKAGPLLLVLEHNPYMDILLGEGFIPALPPISWVIHVKEGHRWLAEHLEPWEYVFANDLGLAK